MHAVLVIPLYLAIGFILRRFFHAPAQTPKALNHVVIWFAFPALILVQFPKLLSTTNLSNDVLLAIAMPWLQFAMIFAISIVLYKKGFWSKATAGCVILTSGLANTSFVGFPLVELFFGIEGLRIALLVDQLGTFLVLSTLGIIVGSVLSGREISFLSIIKKILTFPPFVAVVVATLLHLLAPNFLPTIEFPLSLCAKLLVPAALISVGYQLNLQKSFLNERKLNLSVALLLKLVIMPSIFFLFYVVVLGRQDLAAKVTVLESAMAPMITGAIVAADFDLDPKLASLMVSIGIPISLITVSLWNWLL